MPVLVSTENEITSYRRSSHEFPNDRAFAAINNQGGVIAWGDPEHGGDISSVENDLKSGVQQVYTRAMGFAALKDNGSVISWGDYYRWEDIDKEVRELFPNLETAYAVREYNSIAYLLEKDVVDISSSLGAFAAVKNDGSVVTWGTTSYGGDSSTWYASRQYPTPTSVSIISRFFKQISHI